MTGKIFEALRDCTSKIKYTAPTEAKIKEMFSFLTMLDRLAEICNWEGPSGLRLEADHLPENTAHEKAFKESIFMWLNGSGVDEASDHAADRYFEENPSGYDAAIFFTSVFAVGKVLKDEISYSFIDKALQFLLPDGYSWGEENNKKEEACHRFDDVKICELLTKRDQTSEKIGKRIADRLPEYKDGALRLILKEITYPDLEKALYVLPEDAENRITSILSSRCIPMIKGDCILNKESISSLDIRIAAKKLEEAILAYDGDFDLEAPYED